MGMLRSTATVGGMTLASRLLGLVRDLVLARLFGAGAGMDAFFVAFKIPNFLRRLFAEGAFSLAFVPVLSDYRTRRSPRALRSLVDHVFGTLSGILLLVTVAGVVAAPVLVMVFAPGFTADPAQYDLAVSLLRLTFPYLLCISLTAFCAAVLNAHGRFAVPAFTPVLLNVCLISAAWWLAPHMNPPVQALAWGVLAAGMAQLLLQLPFMAQIDMVPRPRWRRRHAGVRRVLRLMIPALVGSSVAQINLLFDTLLASFLPAGSVSWLYYSDRLMEFPLGVLGVALGTVILPNLSRHQAAADSDRFSATLGWALRWTWLAGLPAMLGLMLLAGPILTTLFQYDAFRPEDVRMASLSLIAYAAGLPAFLLVKVLAPGFYARQDMRTPVRIAIIAMVANMILNLVLVWPLAHVGLALATSLAAYLNAGLLYWHLRRGGYYRPVTGGARWVLRIATACLLLGGLLWWQVAGLEQWLAWPGIERVLQLAACIGAGIAVYLGGLVIVGVRPRHLVQPSAPMTAESS